MLFPIDYQSKKVPTLLGLNPPTIHLCRCRACGHHYANPRMSEALLARYYREVDSELYSNTRPDTFQAEQRHVIERFSQLAGAYAAPGAILDIGCGYGFFLEKMKSLRWTCFGIEPSPTASVLARQTAGCPIACELFSRDSFSGTQFDAIAMFDVLEHLSTPSATLQDIHSRLRSEGRLFIATGDIGSLNARMMGQDWGYFGSYEHISFFSRRSIAALLERNGFRILGVHSYSLQRGHWRNLTAFGWNARTVARNNLKRILQPILQRNFSFEKGLLTCDHIFVAAARE